MADFFQNGVICTLQKLRERPLEHIEDELRLHSQSQRIALVLPALYSEFETESMTRIVEELKGADYVYRFIVSLDRADESQFEDVRRRLSVLPSPVRILWHDGPRMQKILERLDENQFEIAEQGKGRGVWLAIGYALTYKEIYTIALHDCDIRSYRRELLARLLYPVVQPATDFEFSKGYYARADGKLYGRVTRLFYTPLIRALQRIEPRRAERYLDYMDSFRYALSGEFALIRSLAKSIRISPGWGLEVALLSEIFDHTTTSRVCQVELAETYEHKHQELAKDDTSRGLTGMALDIAQTLFRVLAHGGVTLSQPFFDTLLASYEQESRRAIERYNSLALLNGLDYNRHDEIEAVSSFMVSLRQAQKEFRANPMGAPLLSPWVRIRAGIPDLQEQLQEAVERDSAT